MSRLAIAAMLTPLLIPVVGCSDLEDSDHYGDSTTKIENSELTIAKLTSEEYIKSRSDFSMMDTLFVKYGIYDELNEKGQLSTILMVENSNYSEPSGSDAAIESKVRSHVSDMSVSPANLHDGDRLMMWHGKYTNITMDEEGKNGNIVDHIYFNNGVVKEVIQTSNGYIYVISEMIETPTSLYDFINSLGDDYSIFKDLVLSSGGKEFDRDNSKPIGIGADGNTIYDSVFIYTNTHFEEVDFDMNSESLTATMLLPSNDVINSALSDAHARLQKWGLERSDSALKSWILDVSFFGSRLTAAQLNTPTTNPDDPAANDINSIFSKQWRPGQHVVATEATELSNGIAYNVKKLYIPNNVLIYRLKDKFNLYEYCTDQQKANYFKMFNMQFIECKDDQSSSFTPLAGIWPEITYRVLVLGIGDADAAEGFSLDFTPIRIDENNNVEEFLIPPGAYRLAFGSVQNLGLTINGAVIVNGVTVATTSDPITIGSSTEWHYDRGTSLPNRYPEGYDPDVVTAMGGSKTSNYDTDGGRFIDEVVIPDVNGDGTSVPIVIRIAGDTWGDKTQFKFFHWCLRPTVNNY